MISEHSIPGRRIEVVDALRGFAVMAIMLVHFLEHFIYDSYPIASSPVVEAMNQTFKDAFFFLFAGKSYTIFALLFGFTYAIQLRNQAERGDDFCGRFLWRMVLLAGFACLNSVFFPGGDVLLTFATAGIILVPLRKLPTCWVLFLGFLFLCQPLEWGYTLYQYMNPGWVPPNINAGAMYAELKQIVDTGNFWHMAWENLTLGQLASYAWGIDAGRLMQAPGLFILGFVLGKEGLFIDSEGNRVFWIRTLIVSMLLTFVFYVGMLLPGLPATVKTVWTMWHNVSFTGIWVAGFVLLYRFDYFRHITTPLKTYGKMSLTNYVSQSIIGSLIFFPYALGLAPHLGYIASFAVGFAAMLGQILFCRWWLARHKYGPLEGLWHKATWIASSR